MAHCYEIEHVYLQLFYIVLYGQHFSMIDFVLIQVTKHVKVESTQLMRHWLMTAIVSPLEIAQQKAKHVPNEAIS